MKAYVDSDVLIWHLRGEPRASAFLKQLRDAGEYKFWIGALQRAEIVFFMRPEEEKSTGLLLSQFSTAAVDEKIVEKAGALYRKWKPSHGIDVNDAILAATALETGGRIFTLNLKHYPMEGLAVTRAW